MTCERTYGYLAECFLPGVRESDVYCLDERAAICADELTLSGQPILYLGSLLMRDDEVVFFLFEGPRETVEQAAERARIPFERIIETARSQPSPPTQLRERSKQ